MKNMSDKTKRWMFIAGGLVLSAVLVAAIAAQYKTPPAKDAEIPAQSSKSQSVVVEIPDMTEKENTTVVPPIKAPEETESVNGVDKGIEQTIQPDIPKKPTYTEEQLTNPDMKPNGEKAEPEEKEPEKASNPEAPPKNEKQPQGGDTKNGKVYVPGFGWIDDIGEGQGTVGESDGDINKQVGIMGE